MKNLQDKMNRQYLLKEAPIVGGLTSIGVSIMGLGVGITLVIWGIFVAVVRVLAWPFRKRT